MFNSIRSLFSKNPRNFVVPVMPREVLGFALENEILNEWEREFYVSTYGYKRMTASQAECRARVNEKIARVMADYAKAAA